MNDFEPGADVGYHNELGPSELARFRHPAADSAATVAVVPAQIRPVTVFFDSRHSYSGNKYSAVLVQEHVHVGAVPDMYDLHDTVVAL